MLRPTSSRSSPSAPSTSDVLLPDPPSASVTAIVFSPTPVSDSSSTTDILVSSWDHNVHHYQLDTASLSSSSTSSATTKIRTFLHEAPVLDVCFINPTLAASASVDRRVRLLDLSTGKSLILGKHDDSVTKLRYCPSTQLLMSGSSDRSLCFWEVNASGGTLLKRLEMPDKVIGMDVSPPFPSLSTPTLSASSPGKAVARNSTPRLVVALTGRHVWVYDLLPLRQAIDRERAGEKVSERHWQPDQKRESSLKFMARDLRCMPAGDGYAISSIEGRIGVEFFDPKPETQALKYAFKCHRQTIDGDMAVENEEGEEELERPYDVVYPVHGVAFHPRHGTFASLGGDAQIAIWDAAAKKRVRQYPKLNNAVTAGAFDPSGTLLLVATGSDSIEQTGDVQLVLKTNVDEECRHKPKSKSSKK
ncbi:WD40 repeat [Kalmanozyma brasiliensis GHG001]|uniref:Uncharacterized protein n=1 Tax=Kalmanozyma brasiliensis (strain GHG001) TaxID=1365824 RepID=V5ERZ4_KALBG|nr:WD40 repeat [Kalmanozyma brasiliensis GHG001]EST04634.1 WD40 repeat [Kalmanozyma brasiliensis GHG001]